MSSRSRIRGAAIRCAPGSRSAANCGGRSTRAGSARSRSISPTRAARLCSRVWSRTNFVPGTLEKWGLGWEVLSAENPRLVLARVSGWGQDGPYRDRPGFGTMVEAMSGFAAATGPADGPPTLPSFPMADMVAALAGAAAVLAALRHRDHVSGRGQVIDLSL